MISANPLKMKELEPSGPLEASTRPGPSSDQVWTNGEPSLDQIRADHKVIQSQLKSDLNRESNKPKMLNKGKSQQLIALIVEAQYGLNAAEIFDIVKKFCRLKNYRNAPEMGIHDMLKKLVDKNILTRIKVNDIYYYYKRIE